MKIKAADLFCGAGGTSHGLLEACQESGMEADLTAINHWEIAVATHSTNHPEARHLCASLDSLNPRDLFREDELDILWASPECTNHSVARGGRPINDQSRATAWCVVRWAEALRPKVILVENVREFLDWGPIGVNGKPLQTKKGETFRAWAKAIESLGYRVDHRILCAADYGDPTTRRRLFIQAVRGRRKISWPEPTHGRSVDLDLFGAKLQPWVAARQIIDWSDPGRSIFQRKKPLAEKTMRRIMMGLKKFSLGPFVLGQQSGAAPRSVDCPAPTVAGAGAISLAQPFLVKLRGTNNAASIDEPSPALTAGGNHIGLAQPYLVEVAHGNDKEDHAADERRSKSVDEPLGTVVGSNNYAIATPFLVEVNHGGERRPKSVDEPLPTITCGHKNGDGRNLALCNPFLVKFYGTGAAQSLEKPMDTITGKDRFGLARPVVKVDGQEYHLDIYFRMLKPKELARAQGFPDSYQFTGTNSDVVKQIGNAVPTNLAKALVKAVLAQL